MAGLSAFAANKLLDMTLRGTSFTPPSTYYVGLVTSVNTTPLIENNIAAASEVSGGSYIRQAIPAANFSIASGAASTITVDVIFPTATASWGTIYQAVLMDSLTAGNVWWYGSLATSANLLTGDSLKIPASSFNILVG